MVTLGAFLINMTLSISASNRDEIGKTLAELVEMIRVRAEKTHLENLESNTLLN